MRLIRITVAALAAVALTPAVAAQAAPARTPPRVQIAKIWYNSPGRDTGSNASLNGEWVQLRNTTRHPILMRGWTVRDTAGHVFTFADWTLPARSLVKIHTGTGSPDRGNRYWSMGWYAWNNDGDTATVKTARGAREDSCSYSDPGENHASVNC